MNKSTLTENEAQFLNHVMMFGSDGYPIQKSRRGWLWIEFFGCKGAPIVYKTKRDCVEAVGRYIDILIDKKAGRL